MRRSGIFEKLIWKAEWKVATYLWKFKPIRYAAIAIAIILSLWHYFNFLLTLH